MRFRAGSELELFGQVGKLIGREIAQRQDEPGQRLLRQSGQSGALVAGCIGGGCGALVCALTSLAASGTGVTGIFGILLCLAQPVQYAIMFAVAALVSFAVSFVLYKDEPKASEQA